MLDALVFLAPGVARAGGTVVGEAPVDGMPWAVRKVWARARKAMAVAAVSSSRASEWANRLVATLISAVGAPAAAVRDVAQLRDVDVDRLAGSGHLVAADRFAVARSIRREPGRRATAG